MKRLLVCAISGPVIFLIFSSACASAATTETENYTSYYVTISSTTLQLSADRTITAIEFQGITRSDRPGGMFDNMTARCLGTRELAAGVVTSRGSCTEIYPDGSQTFTTYLSQGLTGVHTFVGGTGKYAGISGKADYTVQVLKAPETARMFVVHQRATYTLP